MAKLHTWITAERGRASALAAHLQVSRSRISQMVEAGVPAKYMLAIRNFTGGAVTLEEMVAAKTPELAQPAPQEQGHA